MAYDFISISNRALQAVNEDIFADSTEFSAAIGFHQFVKDAVNRTISDILNEEDNTWQFQRTEATQVLTIGTQDYAINSSAANVDYNSFFIDKIFGDETDFTSVTADSGTKTFTITSGSFITKGFEVGMKVQWSNLESNTDTDLTINTLTALVMTVDESVTTISSADTDFEVTNAFDTPDAVKLALIGFDNYRDNLKMDAQNATNSDTFTKPSFVVRNFDNSLTFGPLKPDATYLVKYFYFTKFVELTATTDAPTIPARYENVIFNGVMRRINEFRDNEELSRKFDSQYIDGVNKMRRNLIPQPESMRVVN